MWNGEGGVEGSVETDIKHPDVQKSLGENPQPRREEGPVGNCRQAHDSRPNEGACCCVIPFLPVCLPPYTVSFDFFMRVPIACVILFVGII